MRGIHNSTEFSSPAPVASVRTEHLWALLEHPLKGRSMVECPVEVTWLREVQCVIAFCHGGLQVHELERYGDASAFGQCVQVALPRALKFCEKFAVNAQSSASIELHLKVCDAPALAPQGECAEQRAPAGPMARWTVFPQDKFRVRAPMSFDADLETEQERKEEERKGRSPIWRYPTLGTRFVASPTVWTSKSLPLSLDGELLAGQLMEQVARQFQPKFDPLVAHH